MLYYGLPGPYNDDVEDRIFRTIGSDEARQAMSHVRLLTSRIFPSHALKQTVGGTRRAGLAAVLELEARGCSDRARGQACGDCHVHLLWPRARLDRMVSRRRNFAVKVWPAS